MATIISKNDFLTGITGKPVELEVPDLGTVKVKALDYLDVQNLVAECGDDQLKLGLMIAFKGLVDPKLDSPEQLQIAKPSVIRTISKRVQELSGMVDAADLEKKVGNGS